MKEQLRHEIIPVIETGSEAMSTSAEELVSQIKDLPDTEKLRLVDAILNDLDKPDPEIERIWATEAKKRWAAYKAGGIPTISYEEVMAKYRR
jgi:putative addiction module component (TIGR02574 family)